MYVDVLIGHSLRDHAATRCDELPGGVDTPARRIRYLRFNAIAKIPNVILVAGRNVEFDRKVSGSIELSFAIEHQVAVIVWIVGKLCVVFILACFVTVREEWVIP